jgi:hypothetical protein
LRIIAFFAAIGSAWGQNPTPTTMPTSQPSNGYHYAGRNYFPTDKVPIRYCAWHTVNGRIVPTPGISPVPITGQVQSGSGFHSHTGGTRPLPALVAAGGPTDSNGCSTSTFQMPGYSGWYTFVGTPASPYPVAGVNTYGVYYQRDPQKRPLYLIPYLDISSDTMDPSDSIFPDWRHGDTSGLLKFPETWGGNQTAYAIYARYMNIPTSRAFQESAYRFAAGGYLAGYPKLELIRASLPHGGIADNEVDSANHNGSPEFVSRIGEQHLTGNEFDIINPLINQPPNPPPGQGDYFVVALAYLTSFNCILGRDDPGTGIFLGSANDELTYWHAQTVVHFTCSPSPNGFH